VETISTVSCVSARSGAEKPRKAADVTSPTTPTRTTAWKRRWCVATSAAQVAASNAQSTSASGVAGSSVRVPVVSAGPDSSGQAASATALATIAAA
jgi:hypothetical protein